MFMLKTVSKYRKVYYLSAVLLAVGAVFSLSACGGSSAGSLEIQIDGSSTVAPISEIIAEDYISQIDQQARITVAISGTGGGFKRFVTGETHISNASRPITDDERNAAKENGVEFIELTVARDGLAIAAANSNSFLSCLSTEQLENIWKAGSTIVNWNQVDPSFPDLKIDLYGPDEESGTYDYFNEAILHKEAPRVDYTPSSDDNVLVRGVSNAEGGLGYFGLAYYIANSDSLKLISVDSGDGCVEPNSVTVKNGDYSPLSRPLFIYVNTEYLLDSKFKSFVEYYLNNTALASEEVGYIAISEDLLDQQMLKINP